ncbi:uncharacterized protein LOC124328873 isoform X2 [Daphnia pulicaria]|uniref:uncharacterized protein LOC124328873 isoform X2 n=1 Tax=Daphnia pulicaria TaxID=35523 RepID=UPI001EECD0D3|nr:uncharacterized protein LOC124328873 isoform X2 [Daphnia pulicaria]
MICLSAIFIHICCISLLPWSTCSTGTTISLEDRLEHLTVNYIQFKEKLQRMEGKVTQLEIQAEKHVDLEAKYARMEALLLKRDAEHKMLSEKVGRLELEIWKSASRLETTNVDADDRSALKNAILRTCLEIHETDPSLNSGMYWIDPDGIGVGDGAIYVYCDMTSGSTSIPHDSESPMDVGHCADPGCYSRPINYNATARQMTALAELSYECHQSIRYDCNFAPFEHSGIAYGWWNDKDGNAKYFWSGDNTNIHTCQCGIDQNCVESTDKCNCDSAAPLQLFDSGIITDKSVVPMTRLNFGRTQLNTSSGVHTLGKLECSGRVAVTGMPKSCEDLWRIGHTLSGLYSIMGAKMVESVYCDFTKLPNDAGFQTWIGFEDVKSSSVYFYVQRYANYNQTGTSIPYDVEKLNAGGAMNLQTGIFTAPKPGKYFFSVSGKAGFPASSTWIFLRINLYKNSEYVGFCFSDEISASQFETFSLESTLDLRKGDTISLKIVEQGPGVYLRGGGSFHFTGWLLEEDIFPLS